MSLAAQLPCACEILHFLGCQIGVVSCGTERGFSVFIPKGFDTELPAVQRHESRKVPSPAEHSWVVFSPIPIKPDTHTFPAMHSSSPRPCSPRSSALRSQVAHSGVQDECCRRRSGRCAGSALVVLVPFEIYARALKTFPFHIEDLSIQLIAIPMLESSHIEGAESGFRSGACLVATRCICGIRATSLITTEILLHLLCCRCAPAWQMLAS